MVNCGCHGARRPVKLEHMENDPQKPFAGADWSAWEWKWRQIWRARLINDPGAALFASPLLFVPAAISGNRLLLALTAGAWVIGQVGSGLAVFVGDRFDDDRPTGAAFWRAAVGQAAGLIPWLLLPLAWPSLTTWGLLLLVPTLAAWSLACLSLSAGEGTSLLARFGNSPFRGLVLAIGGIWAFVGFVIGLVLLIKALHPLS
jgi:hypothetical protein